VTIMRVVSELDAGPMFAIRRRPIGPEETSTEVEQGLAELGADLLLEVVEQMAAGRAVETPQDDSRATLAPKITKSEGRIDWSLPAQAIHNLVRGLQPWPLVSARLDEIRLLIHRTESPSVSTPEITTDMPPGAIVSAGPGTLSVLCGDRNVLRITSVQPEGRRVMSVRDFLAGHAVGAGARLETP